MLPHPLPVITAMILLALLSLTNLVPAQPVILEGNLTPTVFLPVVLPYILPVRLRQTAWRLLGIVVI